jgi:uncharacterized protein (DUF427 family)
MTTAKWNGHTLAESDETVVLEGNHYFPPGAVNWELLEVSDHHTTCPWKGEASYYDITVNGERNRNAAWIYPDPSQAARHIEDHVAFRKGVSVQN